MPANVGTASPIASAAERVTLFVSSRAQSLLMAVTLYECVAVLPEIGREGWRERAEILAVAVSLKKKGPPAGPNVAAVHVSWTPGAAAGSRSGADTNTGKVG